MKIVVESTVAMTMSNNTNVAVMIEYTNLLQ